MPDKLDPAYCRREAARMRAKGDRETDPALRAETLAIANHFDALATEIERYLRDTMHGRRA